MESLIIPPAPNCYLSNILACAPDNTVIYGAASNLVIIGPGKDEKEIGDIEIIHDAHSQSVISVNVNSNWGNPSKLAVSTGEDRVVRLWDIRTCKIQRSNRGHTTNPGKIINAAFSAIDHIISCCENGLVIIWKFKSNELKTVKNVFGHRVKISSMSPCPDDPNLCAFGSEYGLIFIADLKNRNIRYKFKNHNKNFAIVSMTWSQNKVQESEAQIEKTRFLATASRTGEVFMYEVGISGQLYKKLDTKYYGKKQDKTFHNTHVAICWIGEHILLSSSPSGELFLWDVSECQNEGFKPRLVHHDHIGNIFTIATNSKIFGRRDELHSNDVKVWTVGLNGRLLMSGIGFNDKKTSVLTTVANVVNMVSSTVNRNRIAISFGDGDLRIWDLSQNTKMTSLFKKINDKVISLAWHPTKELLLAYGTCEGRVGTVGVGSTPKAPVLLTQKFKSEIRHLEWGPEENDIYIYVDSRLVIYKTNVLLYEPKVVVTENVMSFSWKLDYSILAVGTKSGEVHFYEKDNRLLSKVSLSKCAHSLVWHPIEMDEKSANWLAITTNKNVFYVYNCEVVGDVGVNSTLIATLNGRERVNAVAWSTHEYNKIVSVGEDGIVLIWNVETRQKIGLYVGEKPIAFVLWSPLDKDFIVTAGRDNSIRISKVSKHPSQREHIVVQRNPPKRIKTEAVNKSVSKLLDNAKRLLDSRSDDILDVFMKFEEKNTLPESNASQDTEREPHREQMVSLLMGDTIESIKKAINDGNVTPWLINMIPVACQRLQFQACEAYAKQLMEKAGSDPIKIVSYLLACHKVEEAVNVLIDAAMFREALAIAKEHLPHLINKIFDRWLGHCNTTEQHEKAAQIFIVLKRYKEAAEILYKSSDPNALNLALELSEKINDKNLYERVLARYKTLVDKETLRSLPGTSKENL